MASPSGQSPPHTAQRPMTALALSMPDRNARVAVQMDQARMSMSLKEGFMQPRPQSAGAGALRLVTGELHQVELHGARKRPANGVRAYGRASLIDKGEGYEGEAHLQLGERGGGLTMQNVATGRMAMPFLLCFSSPTSLPNAVPKILRDYERSKIGFPMKGPDRYLKRGDGCSLAVRVLLKDILKKHPVNRWERRKGWCKVLDMGLAQRGSQALTPRTPCRENHREPPFRKGTGGVALSWESAPRANSIFRHLYDNGTIDFCTVRWGHRNEVYWGALDRPGVMSWGDRPTDIQVAKWLPIFLEGIREYEVGLEALD